MMRFQAFGEQREPIAKGCDNFYLSRRSVAKMLLAASSQNHRQHVSCRFDAIESICVFPPTPN